MAIIRRKIKNKFTLVPNSIAQDENLSYEARGVLIELLSRPNNWVVRKSQLLISSCKYTKLSRIFKELKDAGYIEVTHLREKGKIIDNIWNIYDYPNVVKTEHQETRCSVKRKLLKLNNTNTYKETNTNISCTIETKVSDSTVHKKQSSKQQYTEEFEESWASYPRRIGSNSKKSAFKSWNARLKQKVPMSDLTSAIQNYAYYCERTDKLNTEYVMQASRFLGTNEEYKNFITMEIINEDFNKQQKSSNKFDGHSAILQLIDGFSEQEKRNANW